MGSIRRLINTPMRIEFTNEELEKIAEKVAAIMAGKIIYQGVYPDTLVRNMPCKSKVLRTKVLKIMRNNGNNQPTLADVAKYSKSYYLRCPSMGGKSVAELSLILSNAGLSFGELDPYADF